MTEVWITIVALVVSGALIRASGPLAMGGRRLPPRFTGVVDLLAPALLTALIVVETLGAGNSIEVDASLAGVAAAGALLLRRPGSLLGAIVLAAAVTALLRALA